MYAETYLSKFDAVIPFPKKSTSRNSQISRKANITIKSNSSSSLSLTGAEALVRFYRLELNLILSYYGRMVAKGEWRDYAIDMRRDCAVFSIFKHTSEQPLYRVEKHPKLTRKQGAYLVVASSGQILKRGQDLGQVLKTFDKKIELVQS